MDSFRAWFIMMAGSIFLISFSLVWKAGLISQMMCFCLKFIFLPHLFCLVDCFRSAEWMFNDRFFYRVSSGSKRTCWVVVIIIVGLVNVYGGGRWFRAPLTISGRVVWEAFPSCCCFFSCVFGLQVLLRRKRGRVTGQTVGNNKQLTARDNADEGQRRHTRIKKWGKTHTHTRTYNRSLPQIVKRQVWGVEKKTWR